MSSVSTKPEGFDDLVTSIENSHKEPGTSDVHEAILKRCIQYLRTNHQGRHWFCDPYMFPITTHILILFSFPNQNFLQELKPSMAKSLGECPACVNHFNLSKSTLRENFAITKGIPIVNVNHFLKLILDWESSVVAEAFSAYCGPDDAPNIDRLTVAIHQCLAGPALLRSDKSIREAFKTVFADLVLTSRIAVAYEQILQGLIYLSFEGTSEQKAWSEQRIAALRDRSYIFTKTSLVPPIVEEFSIHLYKIQDAKFFTEHVSAKFWSVLFSLLDIIDNDSFIEKLNSPKDIQAMSEFTNIRLYPIIRVFFNNIMSYLKEPLPILLKLLDKFFTRFSTDFWTYATPFIYSNVLDNVVSHPEFARLLLTLPESTDSLHDWCLKDVTQWIFSMMDNLTESQIQTASIRIATFFLKHSKANKGANPDFRFKVLDTISFEILLSSFRIGNQSNDFRNKSFSVNLLRRREVRAIIEYNADTVVDLAVHSDISPCIKLISESLEYDLALLAHNSSVLLQDQEPASYDTFPFLWQILAQKPIYSHQSLTTEILKVLRNASSSIEFIPKKKNDGTPKKLLEARKQHNTNVSLIFKLLGELLEKISLADPSMLKDTFISVDGSIAIWSCVFSPLVNQAALDILYQTFDVGIGGRFEAIQELLGSHLKPTITAVNEELGNLTLMEAFEPCPKAIRLMMDVFNGLCDPLTGVLSSSGQVRECHKEIQELWSKCWSFLVMVYQKTLVWANFYHLEDLIEFTRDTLDLSHVLLNSFRIITDNIAPSDNTIKELFADFMNAFKSVVVWLRLGDMSLLNSCVDLVFNGFDLAKDLKQTVDSDFLEMFVKYGAKAKKFNNKLTENQRQLILAKAKEFDEDLVSRVVYETQQQRNKGKPVTIDLSEDSTPEPAAYKYQTHTKPPKQQTLSRYGVVSSEPPVAPAPAMEIKSSGIDAIRRELKSARAPVKPAVPAVAPAPARPAGFNSRKAAAPIVGRSLNGLKKKAADSDTSDEEDGADFGDLFVDKKRKAKVTEVDINGRPLAAISRASKIDQARKEEENMRNRLNVSLKPLYNTILKWNFNSTDEFPFGDKEMYQPTKNTYSDVKEYVKTTEPLLMLECWQGIQSAKQTGQEQPFDLLIGSRTSVDGFFDVYASCRKSVLAERKIGDSDLLVLGYITPDEFSSPAQVASHLKAPNTRTCLAKVREIKSANADFSDITLRVYPSGSMMGVLTPKSVIVAMKIMQMITVEREFSSLKGLQYYNLSDAILSATPNDPIEITDSEANSMLQLYDVNKSQAKAIMGSFNSEGFSLIQGPPGTGKTKTILGIVGYSLSQQINSSVIDIPDGKPAGSENKAKILICAPSNAAVDELVVRLRNGVKNSSGNSMPLNVVRLGRSDAVNAAVRDLALEELVEKELKAKTVDTSTDPQIRASHTSCIEERKKITQELQSGDLTAEKQTELETKLREVNRRRNELAKKLDDQRERVSIAYRTREIEKRNLQAKILTNAQVICSTLSGSAHDLLAKLSIKFDQVIIDEACQCVELSAIIPLRYGCKKCIMVGDPNQLPPTVLSQTAASLNYEQSLFVRMQKNNPNSVYLLDVQYRMHPEISQFPSAEFYNSRLKDGENMFEKNDRPWHQTLPLSPYRFFDIVSKHQRNELSRSLFNAGEAKVALELVEKLMRVFPEGEFSGRVGIISPYKAQIQTLKDIFIRKYGRGILSEIDFNTVDGFQGQEKEIIIMSCVRASETGNVGFLSDIRRMNVALTRARTSLWILGNMDSLKRNKVWKRLLENAQSRDCVSKASPGFLNSIKLSIKRGWEDNSSRKKFKPEPKLEPSHFEDISAKSTKPEVKPEVQPEMKPEFKQETKSEIKNKPPNSYSSTPAGSEPQYSMSEDNIALPQKPKWNADNVSSLQKPRQNKPNHLSKTSIQQGSGSKIQPVRSSVFSAPEAKRPHPRKSIAVAKISPPTNSGVIPVPEITGSSQYTPTNSGVIKKNPQGPRPTSSGTVPKKGGSSIFINRKRPMKKH